MSVGVLFLLHKPRGSKGLWQPVQPGEKLRVAKGKGKKLRLQLNLPDWLPYEDLEQDKIQLQLVECERSTTNPLPDGQSSTYFAIEVFLDLVFGNRLERHDSRKPFAN